MSLPRLSLPHPRRVRAIGVLAASVALVVAGNLASVNRGPETAAPLGVDPAGPGALGAPAAPQVVQGPVSPPNAPFADTPSSLAKIDSSISRWSANLAANDLDFISARNVALLYEGRARVSGDITDYARAQEAASRSLGIEPRQLDVQALHARILLATHEFSRALTEASAVDRSAPNQAAVLAILGDATLELGDVDGAAAIYTRIEELAPGPAVAARMARVAFLRGDPAGAVSLAEDAHKAAAKAGDEGPALSWYAYLVGTLSMSAGLPDDAAAWFDRALADWPGSFLALAGRARAAAALGDSDAAIAGYHAAIAVAPQPDALTALGDLLALRGDSAAAEQQYATVQAIAQLQGDGGLVYNRQLVLFDVNHDRDVARALDLATVELAERKDAYGYDAYAWALLANGRAADADAAMTTALAGGTRDAMFLYHAGEIALALGDRSQAADLLEQALAVRGALDPLSASRASESLESVR